MHTRNDSTTVNIDEIDIQSRRAWALTAMLQTYLEQDLNEPCKQVMSETLASIWEHLDSIGAELHRHGQAMASEVVHRVARPFEGGAIEVYALEDSAGVYEWRIIENGANVRDSGRQGAHGGMNYESPAVAMRDAISWDMGELAS